jgi:NTP pyrophosphatase (non-canonical NTP hydrolase)
MNRRKSWDQYQAWVRGHSGSLKNDRASMALGIAGEGAEVLDLLVGAMLATKTGAVADRLKKHWGHLKPLDRDALTKELGDVLWYVAAVAEQHQIKLTEVVDTNVAKIEARYPTGAFRPEDAQARADENAPGLHPAKKLAIQAFRAEDTRTWREKGWHCPNNCATLDDCLRRGC